MTFFCYFAGVKVSEDLQTKLQWSDHGLVGLVRIVSTSTGMLLVIAMIA